MEWSLVVILLSISVIPSPNSLEACSLTSKYRKLTPEGLLSNADFVFKGIVKEHFNITDTDGSVTKAKFSIHCVHKTKQKDRAISSEIIITDIKNRDSCSSTRIKVNEEVYIALKETRCASSGECDFEFHEVNIMQSAAIPVTEKLTSSLMKTCGLENFHSPKYCVKKDEKNLCPGEKYAGECVEASSPGLKFNLLPVVFALFLTSLVVF